MEINDEIIQRRGMLRSNWDKLDGLVSDQAAGKPMPELQKPIPTGARILDLTQIDTIQRYPRTVQQALQERESRRKYIDEPLSPDELSYLLWATQGVKRVTPTYTKRSAPSAGARHSVETYVFIDRADDVPRGLYRYLALQHKLCLVSDAENLGEQLNDSLHGQRWNSAAVFIWTSIPYRMEWRYSIASHKLIALDVGHICQNLYLACECIGCGTCAIGAYDQEMLDACVGVDGRDEFAIYAAPCGKVESS